LAHTSLVAVTCSSNTGGILMPGLGHQNFETLFATEIDAVESGQTGDKLMQR